MHINEYSEFVRSRMLPGSYEQQLRHFYLGLVGEWGEFCEPLKKHLFFGKPMDDEEMLLELGDVVWYAVALLNLTTDVGHRERYWRPIVHHIFGDSLEQNVFLMSNVIGRAAEFLTNGLGEDGKLEFAQWLFWVLRYANSIATLYFDSSLRDVMDRNVQKLTKRQDNLENDVWEDEF
jgi:NTP pyrophosphatase (non-canonical NTP hydrolase)